MAIVVQDPRELVSDNDVASFKENGFWVGPRILTDDDLASLPDEAERVFAGERDDANWGWRYDAEKPAYQAHSPSTPGLLECVVGQPRPPRTRRAVEGARRHRIAPDGCG